MNPRASSQLTLDELAHAAAAVDPGHHAVSGLASVVLAIERAAGVSLGPADDEPLIVLQRRFGRAHRSLAPTSIGTAELERLADLLRDPAAAPVSNVRRAAVRPGTDVALAGC